MDRHNTQKPVTYQNHRVAHSKNCTTSTKINGMRRRYAPEVVRNRKKKSNSRSQIVRFTSKQSSISTSTSSCIYIHILSFFSIFQEKLEDLSLFPTRSYRSSLRWRINHHHHNSTMVVDVAVATMAAVVDNTIHTWLVIILLT